MNEKMTHPYLPVASLSDVLNYNTDDASTHTPSSLVNAVAEALHNTHFHEAAELAEYMQLDRRKLSFALQIETGFTLKDLIKEFRICQIRQYQASHPKATLDEVAMANGYTSDNSLYRIFLRRFGTRPNGKESSGCREEWRDRLNRRLAEIRRIKSETSGGK